MLLIVLRYPESYLCRWNVYTDVDLLFCVHFVFVQFSGVSVCCF